MPDLDELERLAREATPGPWSVDEGYRNGFGDTVDVIDADDDVICEHAGPDAAYIAAASPDVILDLIARVRAAEGEAMRAGFTK